MTLTYQDQQDSVQATWRVDHLEMKRKGSKHDRAVAAIWAGDRPSRLSSLSQTWSYKPPPCPAHRFGPSG